MDQLQSFNESCMGTEKNRNRLSGQLEHGEESDKTNGDQMAGGKALVDEGELDGAGRTQAVRPTGYPHGSAPCTCRAPIHGCHTKA